MPGYSARDLAVRLEQQPDVMRAFADPAAAPEQAQTQGCARHPGKLLRHQPAPERSEEPAGRDVPQPELMRPEPVAAEAVSEAAHLQAR